MYEISKMNHKLKRIYKIDTDCTQVVFLKRVILSQVSLWTYRKTDEKTRFAYTSVTNQNKFEQIVAKYNDIIMSYYSLFILN